MELISYIVESKWQK